MDQLVNAGQMMMIPMMLVMMENIKQRKEGERTAQRTRGEEIRDGRKRRDEQTS